MRQIWTRIEEFDRADAVIQWHLEHGWVYLAHDDAGREVALLYLTVICGLGVVIHYRDLGVKVSAKFYREAADQALAFLRRDAGVIYATIPKLLIRVGRLARLLGFEVVDEFGDYQLWRDRKS